MHSRRGHALQRADGAGELALQRPLAVEVLDEVGLAQGGGAVEDLVADRARGRQAFPTEQQARGGDLVARDHDGRAVALDLVLDAGLVERLGDGARFLEVEVGIEQALGLGAHVQDDGHERRGHAGRAAEDGDQASEAKSRYQPTEWVQEIIPQPGDVLPPRLGRIYRVRG